MRETNTSAPSSAAATNGPHARTLTCMRARVRTEWLVALVDQQRAVHAQQRVQLPAQRRNVVCCMLHGLVHRRNVVCCMLHGLVPPPQRCLLHVARFSPTLVCGTHGCTFVCCAAHAAIGARTCAISPSGSHTNGSVCSQCAQWSVGQALAQQTASPGRGQQGASLGYRRTRANRVSTS